MKYKTSFFIMIMCILVLSACQGGNIGDVQINVQETSGTPIPATATITSTATIDVLKTALAKVTKTAIVKLTENAMATSTSVPTETTVPTELSTPQSSGWDAYQAISFEEFLEEHVEELSFYNAGWTFFDEKYKVRGAYKFEKRPLEGNRRESVYGFINVLYPSVAEEIKEYYQEELLFLIDGELYWLPVQTILINDFENLADNQDIEIYIIVLGVAHKEDGYSWVIVNTAFVE